MDCDFERKGQRALRNRATYRLLKGKFERGNSTGKVDSNGFGFGNARGFRTSLGRRRTVPGRPGFGFRASVFVVLDIVQNGGVVLDRVLKNVVIVHPSKEIDLTHRGLNGIARLFVGGHRWQVHRDRGFPFERIEIVSRVRFDLALVAGVKMKQSSPAIGLGNVVRNVVATAVTARQPFDATKGNGGSDERGHQPFGHGGVVLDARSEFFQDQLVFGHTSFPNMVNPS